MRRMRVWEVAQMSNKSVNEVKEILKDNGIEVVSNLSMLNDDEMVIAKKLFELKDEVEVTVTGDAIETADNSNKLMTGILVPSLESGFGLTSEEFPELKGTISKNEEMKITEVEKYVELMGKKEVGDYMKDLFYAKECEVPEISHIIDWVNSKRFFAYVIEGKKYLTILPKNREIIPGRVNPLNMKLLNLAISWKDYTENNGTTKEKKELFDKFCYYRKSLAMDILKTIASKNFKDNYRMKFEGITGVALTGNCSLDGCNIPAWYANKHDLKVGDYVLAFRHPIQNLFITLKIEAINNTEDFTDNELRLNSLSFLWLRGDHDGDKINFIPLKNIYFDNKKYFHNLCNYIEFKENCMNMLPSQLKEYGGMKNTTYCIDNGRIGHRTISTLDMLLESKKSMNFARPISVLDYVENQFDTVLNMRTVKDGTGFAGSFCNWLMEVVTLAKLDLKEARGVCDIIQQAALDSKHNKQTGQGYKESVWFKLTQLRKDAKKKDIVFLATTMIDILNGVESYQTLEEDDEYDF